MKRLITQFFSLLFFVLLTASPALAKETKAAADAHPPAKAAHKSEAAEQHDEQAAPAAEAEETKGPTTVKVGLILAKLNKFELGPGSYVAEIFVSMHCDREPCKPEIDLANGKISGKDKITDEKLLKVFKIKADLDAFVDLAEFPFDKHVLPLFILDKNPYQYHYEFDNSTTGMDDGVKLAGWHIDPKFETATEKLALGDGHEVNELVFGIEITRPRVAAVFKSLVPVFFMVFVAGFTLLLKPKSAAGRLSAATAGLMSVVMFHVSATSSLPPLGYLTRMDKFMIATYLIYICNIAFSVAMVRFEEKKQEKLSELTYLIAGGAVPGIALLAWLSVFLKIA